MSTKKEEFWLESRWQLPKNLIEDLEHKLEPFGCLGSYEVMKVEPDEESKRTQSELIAYFPNQKSIDALAKNLKKLESESYKLMVIKRIPQGNWATEWKKYFKPFHLTDKIVIQPSWEDYQKKKGETVITLDPGMAFGTGQHDSTRFCAELICKIKKENPELSTLLDIGCGSGILSIIAKKIGFKDIIGVDIDPASIDTARENLKKNPETKPIDFFITDGNLDHPSLKNSDVVVANIIAETLCELKDDLKRLTNPKGFLILSGIMPERAEMVKERFSDMELVNQETSTDWHAYIYRR